MGWNMEKHRRQCDNVERTATLLYNKRLHGVSCGMAAYDQNTNVGAEEVLRRRNGGASEQERAQSTQEEGSAPRQSAVGRTVR